MRLRVHVFYVLNGIDGTPFEFLYQTSFCGSEYCLNVFTMAIEHDWI